MEALRALARARRPNVVLHDTKRLFWDKYSIKIEFNAQRFVQRTLPESQFFRWRKIDQEILEALGLSDTVRSRRSGGAWIDLYCETEAQAISLFDTIGVNVGSVTCPRHGRDVQVLKGDGTRLKPVIRDQRFWNKYNYRLTMNNGALTDNMQEEVRTWVRDYCEMNGDPSYALFDIGQPSRAYFRTDDDVIYFKLVFHELITDFEQVILIKDIDHASEPVEAVC